MNLLLSKNFIWEKIGEFRLPRGCSTWAKSHCQSPTVLSLDERTFRVYFSCRDDSQVSRIGYTDLKLHCDTSISWSPVSTIPALSEGQIGCFDQHGVFASSVIRDGDQIKLFYAGYTRGDERPLFYTSVGVAVSKDGCKFERISQSPILGRSEYDPCLVSSPESIDWVHNGLCSMYLVLNGL